MAQERLTMRKIREILRLKYEAGLSNRATLAPAVQAQVQPEPAIFLIVRLESICGGQKKPESVGHWGI